MGMLPEENNFIIKSLVVYSWEKLVRKDADIGICMNYKPRTCQRLTKSDQKLNSHPSKPDLVHEAKLYSSVLIINETFIKL